MNRSSHQLIAGAAVGIFLARNESVAGRSTITPFVGGTAAALLTNLPDLLEPATSPNHRGPFHSLAFAALLGKSLHQLSRWQPQTESERFWRGAGMVAISAYLIHLVLDFTTAKSLPVIG